MLLTWLNQKIITRDPQFLRLFHPTDRPYQRWLRYRPCRACGQEPIFDTPPILNVPCHVRRVSHGSGTGIKPPWNIFPGCWKCHDKDHGKHGLAPLETRQRWVDEELAIYCLTRLRKRLGPDFLLLLPWYLDSKGFNLREAA